MPLGRHIAGSMLLGLITGCASVGSLDSVLKQPVASAKAATEIATQAEVDVLKLVALGTARYAGTVELSNLVCHPAAGPDVAVSNLETYADALAAIDEVAEKPKDASYGALLGRFRQDEAATSKDHEAERKAAIKKRDAARARCAALFVADADAATKLFVPPAGRAGGALSAASTTIAGISGVIQSLAVLAEQVERDVAIKATVKALAPQLNQAAESLAAPRNDAFGVQVVYAADAGAAQIMDETALGALVSLHRWWIAQGILARWRELAPCREPQVLPGECLGTPKRQETADSLAEGVVQYRALSSVDTDKMIASLRKAAAGAEHAADDRSLKGLIDSLSDIGGALAGVDNSWSAYEKTRK